MTINSYIEESQKWHDELLLLLSIIETSPLKGTIKWSMPVFTMNNKNLLGMYATKNYVGLWFYQGALLKDKAQKLVNAQAGKTKAMRQWRFTSNKEIRDNKDLIKAYIDEAIANHMAGKVIMEDRGKHVILPPELGSRLQQNSSLMLKFKALSNGKQRDFAEYIANAQKNETKVKRMEKIIPMIENGVGLNDKYKKKG